MSAAPASGHHAWLLLLPLQCALCTGQCLRWQSPPQYRTDRHCPHFFSAPPPPPPPQLAHTSAGCTWLTDCASAASFALPPRSPSLVCSSRFTARHSHAKGMLLKLSPKQPFRPAEVAPLWIWSLHTSSGVRCSRSCTSPTEAVSERHPQEASCHCVSSLML